MDAPVGSPKEWEAIITRFIQDHVQRAGADGLVLGLSGGLDSAAVAMLAAKALGPQNVLGVLMPAADSDPTDAEHGTLSGEAAGIDVVDRPIGPIVDGFLDVVGTEDPLLLANAKARARMMVLYAEAQERNRLVVGTGNKSELLTGYFSKHGDGGNDLQPIGDLYKTQVRELAAHLGVPRPIIEKPPSAGLWAGQTDEDDLGMPYDDLDRILKGIELNQSSASIADRTGRPLDDVERVARMVRRSEHKRHPPVVPKIGARTVGVDWRRSVHWDAT